MKIKMYVSIFTCLLLGLGNTYAMDKQKKDAKVKKYPTIQDAYSSEKLYDPESKYRKFFRIAVVSGLTLYGSWRAFKQFQSGNSNQKDFLRSASLFLLGIGLLRPSEIPFLGGAQLAPDWEKEASRIWAWSDWYHKDLKKHCPKKELNPPLKKEEIDDLKQKISFAGSTQKQAAYKRYMFNRTSLLGNLWCWITSKFTKTSRYAAYEQYADPKYTIPDQISLRTLADVAVPLYTNPEGKASGDLSDPSVAQICTDLARLSKWLRTSHHEWAKTNFEKDGTLVVHHVVEDLETERTDKPLFIWKLYKCYGFSPLITENSNFNDPDDDGEHYTLDSLFEKITGTEKINGSKTHYQPREEPRWGNKKHLQRIGIEPEVITTDD